MLFNSLNFLLFFPIVLFLYMIFPKKIRMYILLIASLFFYMCWNPKFIVLLLWTITVTYFSGIYIDKFKDDNKKKKLVVALSFILNLAVLFYFKYTNFGVNIFNKFYYFVTGTKELIKKFDIILPVGISFFTFQALSYTMDVYRGDIYAEKNYIKYALFVSFFPQLVAGPIERSKNLLKQLSDLKNIEYDNAREGFLLMLWGYFMKMVVADRVAIFVNTVYEKYAEMPGIYVVFATMLFAVQIYCDFAGYSIIATGCAKFFGINLMENFDAPYLSLDVSTFWRRWHISLTSWFKDYLYIPLGGSKKGKLRKYINKMIVFLVSGLWHGANITFVIWGGVNGIYQIFEEIIGPIKNKLVKLFRIDTKQLDHKILCGIFTFIFIDFTWIFFRANNLTHAKQLLKKIFTDFNFLGIFNYSIYKCGLDVHNFNFMLFSIVLLLIVDICKRKNIVLRELIIRQNLWFRIVFLAVVVNFILVFGIWGPGYEAANFIYFQF